MLHITDDTDDLYNQAAKDYPLNTGKPDWHGLRKKMEADSLKKRATLKNNNYLKISLLCLLLLFPYKVLFYDFILRAGKNVSIDTFFTDANNNVAGNRNPKLTGKASLPGTMKNNEKNISGNIFYHTKKYRDQSKNIFEGIKEAMHKQNTKKGKAYTSKQLKVNIAGSSPLSQEENTTDGSLSTVEQQKAIILETTPAQVAKHMDADVTNQKISVKGDDPVQKKKIKKVSKRFYIGIVGGPDITSVKMQPVKKAGITYGFITGYAINKRWNVETGLLIDKKYYYTKGQYFNTKNIPLPYYVQIEHAEGYCNMLEIPVTIQYNFKSKARSGWFMAAGTSSYLMKKEFYNYDLNRYGVNYTKGYTYNDTRNSFMSVLNISAGYTHKLGNTVNFSIEPYIKLPLKKVGIGSLALQSAGITIAFKKFIL